MKYAIVKIKGSQYKVSEGDEILVGLHQEKEKVEPEVLFVNSDGKVSIGNPQVKGAKVAVKVLEQKEAGKKLHVKKFKSKSRYRRKIGFKPKFTRIQIGKITQK